MSDTRSVFVAEKPRLLEVAKTGNADAYYQLACGMAFFGPPSPEIYNYYYEAAKRNHAAASSALRDAADKGNKDAQYYYAASLVEGTQYQVNHLRAAAIKYFKLAADQGHQYALNNFNSLVVIENSIQEKAYILDRYDRKKAEKNRRLWQDSFHFNNIPIYKLPSPYDPESDTDEYSLKDQSNQPVVNRISETIFYLMRHGFHSAKQENSTKQELDNSEHENCIKQEIDAKQDSKAEQELKGQMESPSQLILK